MNTPQFKIYDANGEYQGCTKRAEEAGAVVALLGDGASIRYGHSKSWTLWVEGRDGNAADSYDVVASTCQSNYDARALQGAKALVRRRKVTHG